MAETNSSELPNWVAKRDGRLVAFDADEICQTIFAGTEALRQPNAFLAREMTESVLHFLAQEHGTSTPTTAQIADLVTKVLRELGQPELAQAVASGQWSVPSGQQPVDRGQRIEDSPATDCWPLATAHWPLPQLLDQCRRTYSLQAVFSRDVVAAQDEGWLTLVGLEHPAELEGGVVDWPGGASRSLLSALVQARRRFGSFIVLDSPDQQEERGLGEFVSDLKDGLQATGLHAVINLNIAQPPAWVEQPGHGPLFGGDRTSPTAGSVATGQAFALLEQLHDNEQIRIDWHLSERDFAASSHDAWFKAASVLLTLRVRNLHLAERDEYSPSPALHSFVFDRPRMPIALGEGLDRRHPAVLQATGLHLAPLLDMPGVEGNIDLLLEKLLHLTRMAVSTGAQKRNFLRRQAEDQGDLQRGFLLDRARLTVIPVGLAAVVQRGTTPERKRPELARQIVQRLRQCLIESGRSANLEAVLESPWWTMDREPTQARSTLHGPRSTISPHLAGLTCADFTLSAEDQLRAAGILHQLTGTGTATVLVPADILANAERVVQLLRYAWAKTDIVRLRFAPFPAAAEEAGDLLVRGNERS